MSTPSSAADPDELKSWNKGVRLAGIQLPGMTSGTYRHDGQLTWWDVGSGGGALVIALHDERLSRVIVEVDDPDFRALEQALEQALDRVPATPRPAALDQTARPDRSVVQHGRQCPPSRRTVPAGVVPPVIGILVGVVLIFGRGSRRAGAG